ncbi:MAG: helicase [Hungatella sp.]|nr:helicase [Hungatella sp.]
MGFFTKMREPVFLRESSRLEERLEELRALEPLLNEEGRLKLRQDMRYVEAGIVGERNIAFELKNSHMPVYVIHDLYLRDGELTSQIDYLVVTRKICFVIECKNLYGDIEIDSQGAFIRTMELGRQRRREGIYSPITQNKRHMALLKKLRSEQHRGLFGRFLGRQDFEEQHRSVVVLANPKTVLDARYARQEVRSQVIRADQLVGYIQEEYENSQAQERSDKELLQWARSYLELLQEDDTDYLERYEKYRKTEGEEESGGAPAAWGGDFGGHGDRGAECSGRGGERREEDRDRRLKEGGAAGTAAVQDTEYDRLIKDLRVYRWKMSQAEGIKPYYVFNDNQMMDLIRKSPSNLEELMTVSGFGPTKAEKYGPALLEILTRHRRNMAH